MSTITLNIGSSAIKYLVLKGRGKFKQGSAPPDAEIKNGLFASPEAIAAQLRRLFDEKRLSRSGVICSVNGLPFTYRLFTLPKLHPEAFREALLRAARKEMPVPLEEMYLAWQVFPADNNELQVLVAGITRQPVDNLLAVLHSAGISAAWLDLQPLALAKLTQEKNAIIVDIEKDYSNIVIVADGVPVAMQIVPSLGPQAELQDEVHQVADRIGKMVDFYNGGHVKKPIQETVKILLTGALVDDARAVKYFQEEADYPVEALVPDAKSLAGLPLHEFAANAGSSLMHGSSNGHVEAGIAAYHPISLEDAARQRAASKKRQGGGLLNWAMPLALVIAIAVLVPPYLSRGHVQTQLAGLNAELAQVNTQYASLQNAAAGAKTLEDKIAAVEKQTQSVMAQNEALLHPRNYVADISLVLKAAPENVTYTSLNLGADGLTINGAAASAPAVVQFARNLEAAGYKSAEINNIDRPSNAQSGVTFQIVVTR